MRLVDYLVAVFIDKDGHVKVLVWLEREKGHVSLLRTPHVAFGRVSDETVSVSAEVKPHIDVEWNVVAAHKVDIEPGFQLMDPDKMRILKSRSAKSSSNPRFDHWLNSSVGDDSNKKSNIGISR